MQTGTDQRTEHEFEQLMGMLLRIGVLTSAGVVLLGAVIFLARHGTEITHYREFVGAPVELRSISGIFRGVSAIQGRALIQFGLLLLILTPIARVVFSAVGFLRQRDFLYVLFTLIVLAVLLYGLLAQH